jgi:hypothetical protein
MGDYGAPQNGAQPGGQSMQQDQRQRMAAHADPLNKAGSKKIAKSKLNKEVLSTPKGQQAFQLAALTIVPFCVYVLIVFLTTFMFYKSPGTIMLTAIVVILLCGLQYNVVERCTRKRPLRWKKNIGLFGAVAAIVALCVGIAIHYKWMLYYSKYTNMMTYTNVAPLQPALQFEDAGNIHFTEGTSVDRQRSIGYRHIRSSTTLCVAPVVSSQMAPTDPIVFFAVGVNCCGWRASFHCDAAGSAGARGGLLMLAPDQLVSPSMEWMVEDQFDFKAFDNAIDLLKSVFAVSVSEHFRMLRWVKDPSEEIDHFRKRGLEAALLSCVGYWVVVGFLISYHLALEAQRARQKALILEQGGSFAMA